jgi:PiT family inorganic phosphate transporter
VIRWFVVDPATGHATGLFPKVVVPVIVSPVCGALGAFGFMGLLIFCFRRWSPGRLNKAFGKMQAMSAAWMSFSHGLNDAQKTMGIIALTLFTASKSHVLDGLPSHLQFLRTPQFEIATWVKVCCAIVMGAGTASGGWRIIRTMGSRLLRLQTIHGLAAQTSAAAVINLASLWGRPLSTTHVISTSIMGAGATKRLTAVRWQVMGRIVAA